MLRYLYVSIFCLALHIFSDFVRQEKKLMIDLAEAEKIHVQLREEIKML